MTGTLSTLWLTEVTANFVVFPVFPNPGTQTVKLSTPEALSGPGWQLWKGWDL